MKPNVRIYRNILAAAGIAIMGVGIRTANADSQNGDSLYIGDATDNTVKKFDARTGKYQGLFVTNNRCPANPTSPPPAGCLYLPTGLIFYEQGRLLVATQNVNLPIAGAVYAYDGRTGAFKDAVVPYTANNAPPSPQGIILYAPSGKNEAPLFMASVVGSTTSDGVVQAFTDKSGVADLPRPPTKLIPSDFFHPRGVVIGPDGLLYVSNVRVNGGTGGDILRYDPETLKFKDIFVSDADGSKYDFNRPEGLVFGPDGNLYVTSFRVNPPATVTSDKILIFAGPGQHYTPHQAVPGALIGKIDLDQAGQDRAFAQALLFGPSGRLFVPVTSGGTYAGQVRRYNVTDLKHISYDIFAASSSSSWWFLTFGNTNPVTLNYTSKP